MELNFQVTGRGESSFAASYECPCGCKPRLTYDRGSEVATEGCCCGNEFAVGPAAARHVHAHDGFRTELRSFEAPWGESMEAAWAIGHSTHGDAHGDSPGGAEQQGA